MARTSSKSSKAKVTNAKASQVKKGTMLVSLANAAAIVAADSSAAPALKCAAKSKVVFGKPPSPSRRYKPKDYSSDILPNSRSVQPVQEFDSEEQDGNEASSLNPMLDPNLYVCVLGYLPIHFIPCLNIFPCSLPQSQTCLAS